MLDFPSRQRERCESSSTRFRFGSVRLECVRSPARCFRRWKHQTELQPASNTTQPQRIGWRRFGKEIVRSFCCSCRYWRQSVDAKVALDLVPTSRTIFMMLLEAEVAYVIGIFRCWLGKLKSSKHKTLSQVIQYFDRNRQYM